jgi:hypothetical protein
MITKVFFLQMKFTKIDKILFCLSSSLQIVLFPINVFKDFKILHDISKLRKIILM